MSRDPSFRFLEFQVKLYCALKIYGRKKIVFDCTCYRRNAAYNLLLLFFLIIFVIIIIIIIFFFKLICSICAL
jgi:hypothetical protein